jgi:CelD/BcsL family acetyltransferase involved in cellulose biosynthesis
MEQFNIQCLKSFAQFQSVQKDWDAFTGKYFPGNYNRTHAWLSAWWTTYHFDRPALIYIQRCPDSAEILAVAPLFIRREVFGGFPVLFLQSLGVGVGIDDFLCASRARGFVGAVVNDLVRNHRWHVASLRRIRSDAFLVEMRQAGDAAGCHVDATETDDYYIKFPTTYPDYLQSRTRKFRRNLNQAMNRIEKEGTLTVEIIDPITDPQRAMSIGNDVSATSWQFQQGKSHFNDTGSDSFYANLAKTGKGAGGEEFTALLVDGKPVAYLLGCLRERTYFAVDTAFNAEYRTVSVGRLLFARVFERLIDQGKTDYFDFEGNGEYKDDYATDARKVILITLFNRSWYSTLIRLSRGSRIYNVVGRLWRWLARIKG